MRKQEEGVLQNPPKLEGKKETNKKHQPDLESDKDRDTGDLPLLHIFGLQ
jgi:hypothetical protein